MFCPKFADTEDFPWIKKLADNNKTSLGFVISSALKESINKREILVIPEKGFLQFHLRKNKTATIYHLCAHPKLLGIGKTLLTYFEEYCRQNNISQMQLKCPIDLSANKFYALQGFINTRVIKGKNRDLIYWCKKL